MKKLLIVLIMLVTTTVWAADELLAGKAFTDPSKQIDMPKEWIEQPIQYEKWAEGADLAVSLDQQLYPALLPMIQEYAKQNKLKIAVQEGTCGTSAKAIKDKIADIAGFCCPPSETDRLTGIKFHTIGIGSLALLINPENPVDNLTFKQVQKVFQGNIFRWSDVNGPKRMIQVLGRLHCKQRPGHWRLILDNEDLFSPRMSEIGTISDMISEAADNPYAIGYETLWMRENYQSKGNTKLLSIDSVAPTDNDKLISGDYPLYRTFNITTWEQKPNVEAQKLAKYLIEQAGNIDPKYGIVSVQKLRAAGWKFQDNELIGEPK
ncbi:substrate-binding domain-containing protein [Candidatus Halobeggiatoa sp. HSG11]|nr:substrate-binding domain-containing protein [Candidatus Halobeggiatoa sp. HSG11]